MGWGVGGVGVGSKQTLRFIAIVAGGTISSGVTSALTILEGVILPVLPEPPPGRSLF